MQSIRTYTGEIRICRSCAQPCYLGDAGGYGDMWQHFIEQWDGVICPNFHAPDAFGEPISIDWDQLSLTTLKAAYPDTSGSAFPGRTRRVVRRVP